MRKKIYNFVLIVVLCLTFVNHAEAVYQDEVLADNPLLYFRFEDADMNDGAPVADLGSVGRGGTYRGNSISPIASAPCLSQAAYLGQEDSNDFVLIWDGDFVFGLPDVTYEAWIKVAPEDASTYPRIFQHNGDWLEEGAPGVMMYNFGDYGGYGVIGGDATNYFDTPTDDGVWHHVVATYDSGASTLKELYVDGVSIGTASAPNDLSYDFERIMIGAEGTQWWLSNVLKGAIDEFAIYEGILSANRILLHYTSGIGCDGDCWGDTDSDHWLNCHDNCPDVYNPDQADSDGDNIGDVCECKTANLDGVDPVNFGDFAILSEDWWDTGPGDTNRDDIVDFIDLLQVVEHWLSECGQP